MLPTVTLAPPNVVTNRPSGPKLENNTCEPSFKPVPKIAAIDPGATGAGLVAKLALLTMPPSRTTGPPGAGGEYLYRTGRGQLVRLREIESRSVYPRM